MLFESGLGLAGAGLIWVADLSVRSQLEVTKSAVSRGLLATLPMVALLIALTLSRWPPVVEFRRQVETIVRMLFVNSSWLELALISLAAGVGEELLFRGALQLLLVRWAQPIVAISVASLLFGLAHALSTTYFIAATLVGFYFGWLAMAYDDLIAPMLAHGLYDFIALTFMQQRAKRM